MNWYAVANRLRVHRCQEQTRYGRCNCRVGRKNNRYNPCERAESMAVSADNHGMRDPAEHDPQTIHDYIQPKSCHASRDGRNCNHRGCHSTEAIVDFITETMTTRKAA